MGLTMKWQKSRLHGALGVAGLLKKTKHAGIACLVNGRIPIFRVMQPIMKDVNLPFVSSSSSAQTCNMSAA